MNGYIAIYKGKRAEVYAETSLEAQKKAAEVLKARKQYEVSVYLAEKDGEQVETSTGTI
jgi:biotin synthase-related radical SAM superfamily protein